ncbi:hypothetical protein LCGC14_2799240 [marine sediment metagenome]|uniref:Uncharacterized protein n=1 Tax=marine sediment metagenome TaxID=412755 RepID=A0A0F8ZAC1_9ZZZZ
MSGAEVLLCVIVMGVYVWTLVNFEEIVEADRD